MKLATIRTGGGEHARKPPHYLGEGAEPVTRIVGIGELRNTMVKGA